MANTGALFCQEICEKQYWVTKYHEVRHHTGIEKETLPVSVYHLSGTAWVFHRKTGVHGVLGMSI